MGLGIDGAVKPLKVQEALVMLKKLQEPVAFELAAREPGLFNAALQRIPWLSRVLQDVEATGGAIIKIGQRTIKLPNTASNNALGHVFHFGSLGLAVLDFARIPIVYLAAFILGQKIPFNLDNNARWLYSTLLFALIILSLVLPTTAPIISFIVAGLGIAVSTFLLTRTLIDRYQLSQNKKNSDEAIAKELTIMATLQQQAKSFESRVLEASEGELILIGAELEILNKEYLVQKARLENLMAQARDIEQKIKEVGLLRVVDKSVAIILGAITVIGLILAIYLPPVGLTVLSASTMVGSGYVLARVALPVIKALGNWLLDKLSFLVTKNKPEDLVAAAKKHQLAPAPAASVTPSDGKESTQSVVAASNLSLFHHKKEIEIRSDEANTQNSPHP